MGKREPSFDFLKAMEKAVNEVGDDPLVARPASEWAALDERIVGLIKERNEARDALSEVRKALVEERLITDQLREFFGSFKFLADEPDLYEDDEK